MPLYLLLALTIAAWLAPQPEFPHDPPRELPWELPDYRQAKMEYRVMADGRLAITIQHLPLPGVSPAMLAWFYRVLPVSRVELNGVDYPLYHLFHPSEHGRISVDEAADDGRPGMGVGALVSRREWFGPYNSVGSGRILRFGRSGMTVAPEVGGLQLGTIEHRFERTTCGARYTLRSILGSDLPVVGRVLNFYIRHKQFPPEKISQWLRHQVEEVGSLPYFLPQLYRQRTAQPMVARYVLDIPDASVLATCGKRAADL